MKTIILAAGKGTRTYPLTITTPKLLLPVFNRPLFDYFVSSLVGISDEIIIVIGKEEENPLQYKIREYIDSKTWPIKISYAVQGEQKGTGHALQAAKDFIPEGEKFLVMNGDDIYSKEIIEEVNKYDYSVAGKKVIDPEKWGIFEVDSESNLVKITEKPSEFVGDIANIGLYKLDTEIFKLFEQTEMNPHRNEYELTDGVSLFAQIKKIKVIGCNSGWNTLGYPWHLLEVHEELVNVVDYQIEGEIEENVHIKGRLKLGRGSIIKSGSYIEGDVIIGDNCVIGPNAYLRGVTVIGHNCKVGSAVEIKNSTIFNHTLIAHLSYLGDGILGNNVNYTSHCCAAGLRHDNSNVKTMVKGKLIDTNRRKFSTAIGDNVKLGVGTIIYPGRKIWPNLTTLPGEIVKEDKYGSE